MIERLFRRHSLHRIYTRTDDRNVRVHRLFDRLGFRSEARLVEADFCKGEWRTMRSFALLQREWCAERASAAGRAGASPGRTDRRSTDW